MTHRKFLITALLTSLLLSLFTLPATASGDYNLQGDWNGRGAERGTYSNQARFSGGGHTFVYGRPGDKPLVGDWNGDGKESLGAHRGHFIFLKFGLGGGDGDITFHYGRAGDEMVVGDWDGDGRDTVSILRDGVLHVNNNLRGGPAQYTIQTNVEERVRNTLDAHGCSHIEIAAIGRDAARGMAGTAQTHSGTIKIDPTRVGNSLERVVAHECAHHLQFEIFEPTIPGGLSKAYVSLALTKRLDAVTGSTDGKGDERLADCMTYLWGYPGPTSYATKSQCAQASWDSAARDLLNGVIPEITNSSE